jgi:hypothetical protein
MSVNTITNNLKNGHKWTEEDKELIRSEYKGTIFSATIISQRLSQIHGYNISPHAVQSQVYRLNLGSYIKSSWSDAEKEYLTDLVGKYSVKEIKRKFDERGYKRSRFSISCKMNDLRVTNDYRDGWYTKSEVAEMLGITKNRLQCYIDSKVLKASYHNGDKPTNTSGSKMWHIEESDLRDFIIAHSMDLTGRNVDLFQIVNIIKGDRVK